MRKKQRHKTTSNLPLLALRILSIGVIGVTIVGGALLLGRYFRVKAVECQLPDSQTCPEELSQSLMSLQGSRIFFDDYADKLNQDQTLTQPFSLVKISKKLPNKLVLSFKPESAAYVLESQGINTVVSASGKTFSQEITDKPALLVRSEQQLVQEDKTVDPTVHHTILSIIEKTEELHLPLQTITWVDKSTIRLSMENSSETYILDSERPALELHRLDLVLKSPEYKAIDEPKVELDVRFTMPVLRTQP